jgi:heme-degrading monooxygenase HmoA
MRKPENQPEGFAEFWASWLPFKRKNDGPGDTRKTYAKHIAAGAEPADILDGARGYLRSLTAEEKKYIPLASTWLNREAYADWCEQERAYQARQAARATQADNVVSIKGKVPETHFSRRWERGEIKVGE